MFPEENGDKYFLQPNSERTLQNSLVWYALVFNNEITKVFGEEIKQHPLFGLTPPNNRREWKLTISCFSRVLFVSQPVIQNLSEGGEDRGRFMREG